jgi:hypothetical protein
MGLLALEIILFYAYIVPHVEMTVNAAIMDGLQRAIIKWPNVATATATTSTTDYVAPYAAYLIDQRAMSIALEDSLLMMRIQEQGTVTSIAILAWILCAVTWCFMAMDEPAPALSPACMQLPSSPTSFSLRSDSGVDEVIPQEETLSSLNEVVATFSRHGRLPHDGEEAASSRIDNAASSRIDEATAFSRHRYTM